MKRSAKLRVIVDHAEPVELQLADGRTWPISNARITWTRASCISGENGITGSLEDRRRGKICGAVRCIKHHLLVDADVDRPGRRHANGARPPTQVRSSIVTGGTLPRASCALDVIDILGPQRCAEIGPRLGVSKRRVEQLCRRAVRRLADGGVDPEIIAAMFAMLADERGSRDEKFPGHHDEPDDGPQPTPLADAGHVAWEHAPHPWAKRRRKRSTNPDKGD